MKTIKYIYLPLALLLNIFPSFTLASAILDTNSFTYSFEGGAKFKDGQVNTQTSSGNLLSAIDANGAFNWIGKGEQQDQYNEAYGGYGWTQIKLTANNFNQWVGQDVYPYPNEQNPALSFMNSFIEWDFNVLNENAWLNATILNATGAAHFNIFNITSDIDLFDSGQLNRYEVLEQKRLLLEQGNSYRISSVMNNSSSGGDGWEIESFLSFENATIVSAPNTLLLLIFALLALLTPKKYLSNRDDRCRSEDTLSDCRVST